MQRRCDWCGSSFTDNVTRNEHDKGEERQEAVTDDIPILCETCNTLAKE